MLRFTATNGRTYRIWWDYRQKPATKCLIQEVGLDPGLRRSAAVRCHPNDRFNKETARKLSLARAVEFFDKPSRKAAWSAYFERTQAQLVGRTA